jgi:hypothetical protein
MVETALRPYKPNPKGRSRMTDIEDSKGGGAVSGEVRAAPNRGLVLFCASPLFFTRLGRIGPAAKPSQPPDPATAGR